MPEPHSTAAIGTLPIEQTNEVTAMSGPTSALAGTCSQGEAPLKNSAAQSSADTNADSAPAMRNPPTRSFHSIAQSIAKFWAMTMHARGSLSFCESVAPASVILS
jgi:hypothetical protein